MVISPPNDPPAEDFMDDLAALYTLLKGRLSCISVVLIPFEKVCGSPLPRLIVSWLNPRTGRWYGIALVGILIGVVLALSERHLHPRPGLLSVYVGIECLAVLVGYAFFAKPLRLARHDSIDDRHLL